MAAAPRRLSRGQRKFCVVISHKEEDRGLASENTLVKFGTGEYRPFDHGA
jgi:hypothetical protein